MIVLVSYDVGSINSMISDIIVFVFVHYWVLKWAIHITREASRKFGRPNFDLDLSQRSTVEYRQSSSVILECFHDQSSVHHASAFH